MFNCFMVGNGAVVVKCLHVLHEYGWEINGIFSDDTAVKTAALKKGISPLPLTQASLAQIPAATDYLFSAANEVIIPEHILQRIRRMAINYHNGPLPRYAGVNAVSWAILHNEQQHGITWHKMVARIDAGDILKQVYFPLTPEETALTLSAKCYDAAIHSFRALLRDLMENRLTQTVQAPDEKTYFSHRIRPQANGLIQWNSTAECIHRLCRSLNYGHHDNPMACAKCQIGERIFVVGACQLTTQASQVTPGTITDIQDSHLQISTQTTDVIISALSTLEGKSCSITQLVQQYTLQRETVLPGVSTRMQCAIEEKARHIAQHEKYWVKQLLQQKESCVSHLKNRLSCMHTSPRTYHAKLNLKTLCHAFQSHSSSPTPDRIIITLVALYLFRINNMQAVYIQFRHASPTASDLLDALYATHVPIRIALDNALTFTALVSYLDQCIHNAQSHATFSNDIYARYNTLSNKITQTITIDLATTLPLSVPVHPDINIAFSLIEGNTDLYITSQLNEKAGNIAQQMADNIHAIATQLTQSPTLPLHALPLLTSNMQQRLCTDWNKTHTALPQDKPLHQLLREVAIRLPHKTALQCHHTRINFHDFYQRIDRLAGHLIEEGVQAGNPIAIYMHSDITAIVSMFAVLQVGATYIPIDPSYPQHYITHILEDCQPKAILVSSAHAAVYREKIRITPPPRLISVHPSMPDLSQTTREALTRRMCLPLRNHTAYIIYTSGSTGKPKGVIIHHRSLINLAFSEIKLLGLTERTRTLQFAPLSFDAAVWEIYATLLAGGTLFLTEKAARLPVTPLLNTLNTYQINCVTLPPTVLGLLNPHDVPPGMTVISAGAPCTLPILAAWSPVHRFINAYGPTETTVCATLKHCTPHDSPLCIGRPIHNVEAYVLDTHQHPLPVGSVGMLYIGGEALSAGYLNQPTRTKNSFVPHPFSSRPDARLYKTGDLAYWLPDGNLYYVGRADAQVKVRGFRIEPSAIEIQLQKHEDVKHALVTVRKNARNHTCLVAYLVLQSHCTASHCTQIRETLMQQLPHYMIPQQFMVVDRIPVKINGKVDTYALPTPPAHSRLTHTPYVPATTQEGIALTKIWETVLHIENIGIYDHFFELGGTSLVMSELLYKVNQHFDRTITLPLFIKQPTIAHLVYLLKNEQTHSTELLTHTPASDAILPPIKIAITQKKGREKTHQHAPKNILLTGASGFLGVHLLKALLSLTTGHIYCLVRSNNHHTAEKRLASQLQQYCDTLLDKARVVILEGDLRQPLLGLKETAFSQLSHTIDVIYHAGAHVHHLYSYEQLREANVLSTATLIQLATLNKKKTINYVSTLSAAIEKDNTGYIKETLPASHPDLPSTMSGYAKTKWASERLLAQASIHIPVNIVRAGWIMGDTQTGQLPAKNNHLCLLIKGCIQMGTAPNWETKLNLFPVDFTAHFIARLGLHTAHTESVFNMVNPCSIPWNTMMAWINQQHHGNIIDVPPAVWQKQLKKINTENALFTLLPLYLSKDNIQPDLTSPIHHTNTDQALAMLGLRYPPITQRVLSRQLAYLKKIRFITLPSLPYTAIHRQPNDREGIKAVPQLCEGGEVGL